MKKQQINTCAKRIKSLRAGKDMSQLDLALAMQDCNIELKQHSISMIERGKRVVKDVELLAFAEVLNTHPMYLLFGDDIPDKYK